jgi:hypothetical protein
MLSPMKYVFPLVFASVLSSSSMVFAQSASVAPVNDRAVVLGILAAEFSLQNGDALSAASTYYEVAKRSQDAKVAERAVELLMRIRRIDDAKEIRTLAALRRAVRSPASGGARFGAGQSRRATRNQCGQTHR